MNPHQVFREKGPASGRPCRMEARVAGVAERLVCELEGGHQGWHEAFVYDHGRRTVTFPGAERVTETDITERFRWSGTDLTGRPLESRDPRYLEELAGDIQASAPGGDGESP